MSDVILKFIIFFILPCINIPLPIRADANGISQLLRTYFTLYISCTGPYVYQINGLINDSDIWDFYIKYKDNIDELLNKDGFYEKSPEELNIFSLYDYIIEGTKEAVKVKINSFGQTEENNNF